MARHSSRGSALVMLLASGITLGACAHPAHGGGTLLVREGDRGIHVVGQGEAEARPDRARFEVGVEVRRPTVAEAREGSAAAQTRVIDALRAAGIASEDVQTSQLSVQPEYEYTQQGQRLLGYTARNQVTVRVRSIERLSETVDGAIRAGADDVRLQGISFEHSDPDTLLAQARAQAMARARANAEQLATAAGVTLGDVIAIDEASSGNEPRPQVMMRMAVEAADTATPIEAGTTQVQVQLSVRWGIR
jgi:uncharacterized protein